jgi:hypothetical protein
MARIRCTARKSVIPFLPSRLAERPLRRTVPGQSSHLERLHRHLHEEQERRRQEQEQQDSSPCLSRRWSLRGRLPLHLSQRCPTAPPQGIPAAGGDPDGDRDDDDASGSLSHNMELSEESEPEGWIARPITRDAARGCHFHDALNTLLRRAFDRHTWSIEYRCVVLGPCFVAEGPTGRNTFSKTWLYVIPKIPLMKLRYYSISEGEGSN